MELYQHVKIFPEVLRHEAEEGQEGPAEAVKAGVAVVWIPPSFHTRVALRAAAGVGFFLGETQSRRDRQQGEKRRRKQGTGPAMSQQLFTCHAKPTSGKRERPTARSWWDQRSLCWRNGATHPESELFPHRSASSWPGRK